jgi:hypothetical protein
MSERVKCRKCEAMILVVTARRNRGYCGVCARTSGVRYWLKEVGVVFVMFGVLVAMPFIVLWSVCSDGWRRWRFPFDRGALLLRIRAVHADRRVARIYLQGVIDGYWDGTGEEKLVRRYPPKPVVANDKGRDHVVNPARIHGLRDGARLRLGEIAVEDIPTSREWLDAPAGKAGESSGRCDAVPSHEPPEPTAEEGGEDGDGTGKEGMGEKKKDGGPW